MSSPGGSNDRYRRDPRRHGRCQAPVECLGPGQADRLTANADRIRRGSGLLTRNGVATVDLAARPTTLTVRRFLEHSPAMVVIAALDGYVKGASPAFEQPLGLAADPLTSRPQLEFVHAEDASDPREPRASQKKDGLQWAF